MLPMSGAFGNLIGAPIWNAFGVAALRHSPPRAFVVPRARLPEVVERALRIQHLKTEQGIYRFAVEGELWS